VDRLKPTHPRVIGSGARKVPREGTPPCGRRNDCAGGAATSESVTAIDEIVGTITRLSEIAAAITLAVEERGAAVSEIVRNVRQAAQGTTQVASNIAMVDRGAAATGSASSQVLGPARTLSKESGTLKGEVDKFLATVRAA
jgi:methyl-accepting chemotaxis protein